ncbi:hypothetical protein FGG78_38775, partial [Thioclava sp. BHET1]
EPDLFQRLFFEAMSHPELVVLTEHSGAGQERLYSTPGQVLKELELADRAVTLAGREANRGAIRHRETDYLLNVDQRVALDHVLQGRGLSVLTGPAGSGVTWTLGAAHHAYDKAGFTVVGIAATGAGVDALRQRWPPAGIDLVAFQRDITRDRQMRDRADRFLCAQSARAQPAEPCHTSGREDQKVPSIHQGVPVPFRAADMICRRCCRSMPLSACAAPCCRPL